MLGTGLRRSRTRRAGQRAGRTGHRDGGPRRDHHRRWRYRSTSPGQPATRSPRRTSGISATSAPRASARSPSRSATQTGAKRFRNRIRVRSFRPRDPLTYVVLSLGGAARGFELPKPAGGRSGRIARRSAAGASNSATITDVAQLPDQWFGYDAADLVVLNTGPGAAGFLRQAVRRDGLASDRKRRDALIEWVRRGGRLVVTVGENARRSAEWPALQRPASPSRWPAEPRVRDGSACTGVPANRARPARSAARSCAKDGTFPVANLSAKADRPARVLIPPPDRRGETRDIDRRSACLRARPRHR